MSYEEQELRGEARRRNRWRWWNTIALWGGGGIVGMIVLEHCESSGGTDCRTAAWGAGIPSGIATYLLLLLIQAIILRAPARRLYGGTSSKWQGTRRAPRDSHKTASTKVGGNTASNASSRSSMNDTPAEWVRAEAVDEFVHKARKRFGDTPTVDQLIRFARELHEEERQQLFHLDSGPWPQQTEVNRVKERIRTFKSLARKSHKWETLEIFKVRVREVRERGSSAGQSSDSQRTFNHSRDSSSRSSATHRTTASAGAKAHSTTASPSSEQGPAAQNPRVYSSVDGTYRSSPPNGESADASGSHSTSGQYRSGSSANERNERAGGTTSGQYRSGPSAVKTRAEADNDDLGEEDDEEMTWLWFSSLVFAHMLDAGDHDAESYEYELAKRLLSVSAFPSDDDMIPEDLRLSLSGMSLNMALLKTLRDRNENLIRLAETSMIFPDEIVRFLLQAAVRVAAFDEIIYHEEMHSLQLLAAALGVAQEELVTFIAEHGKKKSSRSHTKRDEREKAYEILGVEMGADAETVKVAYRRLIRVHHPDLAASHERDAATMRTSELNAAYATLIK